MTDTAELKAGLRKTAYAARKLAHATPGLGERATENLLAEIEPWMGSVVAGYMPIRTEIDPRPAMTVLSEHNRICVPVIVAPGSPLEFYLWTPGCEMVEGPFGAHIPAEDISVFPTVLIVPLVGFDAGCNRLGYGGGYYDRTLEKLRAEVPVRAIGFAYAAQELPPLPLEPTDQPLDAIVTERGVLYPSPQPLAAGAGTP